MVNMNGYVFYVKTKKNNYYASIQLKECIITAFIAFSSKMLTNS